MLEKKVFTLAIVRDGDRLLLGKKKRKLGAGKWNGFGGGVEKGETIEEAAVRECTEEAGIIPASLIKRGVLEFHYAGKPLGAGVHEVHVFEVREFRGMPVETDEMRPQWFAVEDIPYAAMWEDDQYWLPLLLEGKDFVGKCRFDKNQKMLDYDIKERESVR